MDGTETQLKPFRAPRSAKQRERSAVTYHIATDDHDDATSQDHDSDHGSTHPGRAYPGARHNRDRGRDRDRDARRSSGARSSAQATRRPSHRTKDTHRRVAFADDDGSPRDTRRTRASAVGAAPAFIPSPVPVALPPQRSTESSRPASVRSGARPSTRPRPSRGRVVQSDPPGPAATATPPGSSRHVRHGNGTAGRQRRTSPRAGSGHDTAAVSPSASHRHAVDGPRAGSGSGKSHSEPLHLSSSAKSSKRPRQCNRTRRDPRTRIPAAARRWNTSTAYKAPVSVLWALTMQATTHDSGSSVAGSGVRRGKRFASNHILRPARRPSAETSDKLSAAAGRASGRQHGARGARRASGGTGGHHQARNRGRQRPSSAGARPSLTRAEPFKFTLNARLGERGYPTMYSIHNPDEACALNFDFPDVPRRSTEEAACRLLPYSNYDRPATSMRFAPRSSSTQGRRGGARISRGEERAATRPATGSALPDASASDGAHAGTAAPASAGASSAATTPPRLT